MGSRGAAVDGDDEGNGGDGGGDSGDHARGSAVKERIRL